MYNFIHHSKFIKHITYLLLCGENLLQNILEDILLNKK